jgi:hypothetical protein
VSEYVVIDNNILDVLNLQDDDVNHYQVVYFQCH